MQFPSTAITHETFAAIWCWTVDTILVALMLMVSLVAALQLSNGPVSTGILVAIFLPGYLLICVLVHELGHAVAAWLVRWRVHLIVVGPRAFAPKSRKFLKTVDNPYQDIAGWVLATPRPGAEWSKGYIPFTLGGAAGNLGFGALSIAAAAAVYNSNSDLFVALVWFGAVSVIFAVANLILIWRPGHWQNDGARVIGAFIGKGPTSREKEIARLCGMHYDGIPVDEWDETLLRELIAGLSDDHEGITPLLLHYTFASGDLTSARSILEKNFAGNAAPPLDYRCDYAFIIAVMDHDALRASEILDELPREHVQTSFGYWRARSVTEHLFNRRELALKAVHKARAVAESLGVRPDHDDEAVFQAIECDEALPPIRPKAGDMRLAPLLD